MLIAQISIFHHQKKLPRLADSIGHPRVILNNDITYLYGSKFQQLIEKLHHTITFGNVVNVQDIKAEPIDVETLPDIKIDPDGTGYEYKITECEDEINCEFVLKREELYPDTNPLDLECENKFESESDDSSVAAKEMSDDPDITTDDFSSSDSTDDECSEADNSDCSMEEEYSDDNSENDTAKRFQCSYCNQLVKNLESHERNHWNFSKNVNRTVCGLCFESFQHQKVMLKHRTDVHGGNAYACDLCNCMAVTYDKIRRHIIRKHCTERPFLCQHCGEGYKFHWDLKRHMESTHMIDKRERSHACQLCEKKFFAAHRLRYHIALVHSDLRPHLCNVDGCNKAFKRADYLVKHRTQVHLKENLHSCIVCGKKFSLKGNLTTHMKSVHKS